MSLFFQALPESRANDMPALPTAELCQHNAACKLTIDVQAINFARFSRARRAFARAHR
jgi:hypothetical protein